MASPCSFHLKGNCKFGAKCRYSHSAQNTVLCLFREPLPAGKVEIEFPNIECMAEAHVSEDDRRILELRIAKIDPPKQGVLQGVWQTAKKAFRGKSDDPIGMAVLLIPAG
jgi:hypothetical protein